MSSSSMLSLLSFGQNIHTIKWNTEAVLVTYKKDGPEVSDVKTKYTFMCCEQNAEGNHNIKMGNQSFWSVAKFKYFGSGLTNHNCIHDEIKLRLNSGKAWYHLVQNLLSSCLLYKNIKIEIKGTFIWHSFYQTNITCNKIDTHSYCACCYIWVKYLVSYTEGRTRDEGVWEQGVVEDIWISEGGSTRRVEKIA